MYPRGSNGGGIGGHTPPVLLAVVLVVTGITVVLTTPPVLIEVVLVVNGITVVLTTPPLLLEVAIVVNGITVVVTTPPVLLVVTGDFVELQIVSVLLNVEDAADVGAVVEGDGVVEGTVGMVKEDDELDDDVVAVVEVCQTDEVTIDGDENAGDALHVVVPSDDVELDSELEVQGLEVEISVVCVELDHTVEDIVSVSVTEDVGNVIADVDTASVVVVEVAPVTGDRVVVEVMLDVELD